MQSGECPFSTGLGLLCAWACCVVSLPGETPEPPISATLGLTASLGFLMRICVLCASKSGKTPDSFSLSLLFSQLPALYDMHEAPHHAAILNKSTGVRRFAHAAPREQPLRDVVLRAWPTAPRAGARPCELSALRNTRCAFVCKPKFESSWGRCSQTPVLPSSMPAARVAGAWPGALALADFISPTHKRTEGRAPVWGSEFTSKLW